MGWGLKACLCRRLGGKGSLSPLAGQHLQLRHVQLDGWAHSRDELGHQGAMGSQWHVVGSPAARELAEATERFAHMDLAVKFFERRFNTIINDCNFHGIDRDVWPSKFQELGTGLHRLHPVRFITHIQIR